MAETVTLFSIPKPFRGLAEIHQRNAIESWLNLGGDWRICLIGDEVGVREVSAEYGIEHIPDVAKNQFGTPLLGSAFRLAAAGASNGLLCYVNTDIILPPETQKCVDALRWDRLVMVCRRYDVDVKEALSFEARTVETTLHKLAAEASTVTGPTAMDLFVFTNCPELVSLPDFAVGRRGWDNWFVFNAWRHRARIIDASPSMKIYHQRHGYDHVPHASIPGTRGGPEADRNETLAGPEVYMFDIRDSTHTIAEGRAKPARSGVYLERRVERMRIQRPGLFDLLKLWRCRYLLARLWVRM